MALPGLGAIKKIFTKKKKEPYAPTPSEPTKSVVAPEQDYSTDGQEPNMSTPSGPTYSPPPKNYGGGRSGGGSGGGGTNYTPIPDDMNPDFGGGREDSGSGGGTITAPPTQEEIRKINQIGENLQKQYESNKFASYFPGVGTVTSDNKFYPEVKGDKYVDGVKTKDKYFLPKGYIDADKYNTQAENYNKYIEKYSKYTVGGSGGRTASGSGGGTVSTPAPVVTTKTPPFAVRLFTKLGFKQKKNDYNYVVGGNPVINTVKNLPSTVSNVATKALNTVVISNPQTTTSIAQRSTIIPEYSGSRVVGGGYVVDEEVVSGDTTVKDIFEFGALPAKTSTTFWRGAGNAAVSTAKSLGVPETFNIPVNTRVVGGRFLAPTKKRTVEADTATAIRTPFVIGEGVSYLAPGVGQVLSISAGARGLSELGNVNSFLGLGLAATDIGIGAFGVRQASKGFSRYINKEIGIGITKPRITSSVPSITKVGKTESGQINAEFLKTTTFEPRYKYTTTIKETIFNKPVRKTLYTKERVTKSSGDFSSYGQLTKNLELFGGEQQSTFKGARKLDRQNFAAQAFRLASGEKGAVYYIKGLSGKSNRLGQLEITGQSVGIGVTGKTNKFVLEVEQGGRIFKKEFTAEELDAIAKSSSTSVFFKKYFGSGKVIRDGGYSFDVNKLGTYDSGSTIIQKGTSSKSMSNFPALQQVTKQDEEFAKIVATQSPIPKSSPSPIRSQVLEPRSEFYGKGQYELSTGGSSLSQINQPGKTPQIFTDTNNNVGVDKASVLTSTRINTVSIQEPKIDTDIESRSASGVNFSFTPRESLDVAQDTQQRQDTAQKVDLRLDVGLKEGLIQKTALREPQVLQNISTRPPIRNPRPPRPPRTPKPIIKLPKSDKTELIRKVKEAFDVVVYERGKEKVVAKGLPFGRASKEGVKEVLTSLRASYKLKPKGTTTLEDVPFLLPNTFRPSKKEKGRFVQKKNTRFGSKSETKEAQFFRKYQKTNKIKWF